MSAVTYDVVYNEQRSRLTTLFRYILAIPHLIVASLWAYVAQFLALLQWFVIVFTGRRHEGMWNFQRDYLAYNTRVNSYVDLLFDDWPAFGGGRGSEPVAFRFEYEASASRLTNGLRFLWIIPALIIGFFLGIALFIVLVVSWFAILITGRHPRGMFDFLLRVMRFNVNLGAYGLLMTDDYPRYDGSDPTGVLPPGDHRSPWAVAGPEMGEAAGPAAGEPGEPPPPTPPSTPTTPPPPSGTPAPESGAPPPPPATPPPPPGTPPLDEE